MEVWHPFEKKKVRYQCKNKKKKSKSVFFFLNWQFDVKIYMEMQTTQNCQNDLEKEQGCRVHTSWF